MRVQKQNRRGQAAIASEKRFKLLTCEIASRILGETWSECYNLSVWDVKERARTAAVPPSAANTRAFSISLSMVFGAWLLRGMPGVFC